MNAVKEYGELEDHVPHRGDPGDVQGLHHPQDTAELASRVSPNGVIQLTATDPIAV